jgi:hypothetical protein
MDGELIDDYGLSLIRTQSRVPILTGVARNEWGHKKGDSPIFILIPNQSTHSCVSAVYYNIDSSMPVNNTRMRQIITNVVDQSYVADDGRKLANSTLGPLFLLFFFLQIIIC